mmetsp:Transcript_27316/g.51004  ORF Transcript_27316/g.51004 Transcript_27316/m.51004 type:complete len:452 (+) Transcript_27316:154-1509(+)|eukprot:CAMPEP_0114419796 /NCGR_PEP_ID=MMETSP0103-20121206/4219_1 /TAXON_ID=37642 ORGANISM="Paraphysomonas imperforata, Strain PA2" /NCGR_SAMPLE_ID=MMETSP0103 /ASSEMBLY_ACC=CAM_ASM_000201 /LENGTH=451 /DNA_ID=CAMNT_0001588241 /DNA_START=81 /DNA_END=1436 /DNA_ORIENTATION=-
MKNTDDNRFSKVLPVLFYEYLALSIPKSILPGMLVNTFGVYTYFMVGVMETIKGLLAFFACPLFGKLSDNIGRKYCLLITVMGTTFPVCVLAFTSNMYMFGIAVALSGAFSATFPLTFAYISDCVENTKRAPAFGLALATLGLSFTIGPILGGYMELTFGTRSVFIVSLCLVVLDVLYVVFYLPETAAIQDNRRTYKQKINTALEYLPNTWNLDETFRVFTGSKFMKNIAIIVFLYYTAVWAVVSTLMVYVTRHLQFSPIYVGWLLSCYGVATMFSEGVLVRYIVPTIGEMNSMRLGLLCFSIQCVVIAFSSSPTGIFFSVLFSMLSNLVYPSISSLVSKVVEAKEQGEAQGALNGIKALTEGFGPLLFGGLMAIFEGGSLNSGSPYLLTAILTLFAFLHSFEFYSEPEDEVSVPMYEFKSINYSVQSKERMGLLAGDGYSDDEDEDEAHI